MNLQFSRSSNKRKENRGEKEKEEGKQLLSTVFNSDKQQIEEEVVLRKEKIYVLKNKKLRIEIIKFHHNVLVVRWKTIKLVIRNYWWPGVTKNMGKYVDKYNFC